jgi:hypothetical protein
MNSHLLYHFCSIHCQILLHLLNFNSSHRLQSPVSFIIISHLIRTPLQFSTMQLSKIVVAAALAKIATAIPVHCTTVPFLHCELSIQVLQELSKSESGLADHTPRFPIILDPGLVTPEHANAIPTTATALDSPISSHLPHPVISEDTQVLSSSASTFVSGLAVGNSQDKWYAENDYPAEVNPLDKIFNDPILAIPDGPQQKMDLTADHSRAEAEFSASVESEGIASPEPASTSADTADSNVPNPKAKRHDCLDGWKSYLACGLIDSLLHKSGHSRR